VIPPQVRFQVEYPTPRACMSWVASDRDALHGSYERALFADLARFLAAVPGELVAVQWDVAVEFGMLERSPGGARSQVMGSIARNLARCLGQVPDGVPAGLHLCYGDYQHHHFMQPESLELQAGLLDAVRDAAPRPVSFAAFTVPQYQRDPAYFEPLAGLRAGTETELYFSLVPYHPAEQARGTTAEQIALIDAALARSSAGNRAWGVCTECGMGRVSREAIPWLLDLHHQIIRSA
jgi:hypothetical protein